MKPKSILLAAMMIFTFSASGQYTPLPSLDQADYEKFVLVLKQKAGELALPEVEAIADNMSYEEARRFIANPHVFAEKLKNVIKPEGQASLDGVRVGIIVNFLMNYLSGLTDGYKSAAQFGYALGLYAMFVLGSVYLMPELLYMYRPAGEKYGGYSERIFRITYLTLFLNAMYMTQGQVIRWMFGGGPAFGLGLSGKQKTAGGNTSLEFGDGGLRRFQAGFNLKAGMFIKNTWMIYIAYTYYFTKLSGGNSDIAMHSFHLGLAYTLGSRR